MKKRLIAACITFLMAVLILLYTMVRLNMSSPVLEAERGIIAFDPATLSDSPYMLTGEWLRYTGALDPDEVKNTAGEFVSDIRYIRKMRGYTYRLLFDVQSSSEVSFMMVHPDTSRMWINSIEVLGANAHGISPTDVFSLSAYGDSRYECVIQTTGSTGDVYQGLLIGKKSALLGIQNLWLVLDFIAIGLSIMLILLSVSLYVRKRSEKYLLLLIVSTLAELGMFFWMSRSSLLSSLAFGSEALYRHMAFINYFICKQMAPNRAPRWLDCSVWCVLLLSVLLGILFPSIEFELLRYELYIYMLCQIYLLLAGFSDGVSETAPVLLGAALMCGNEVFYALIYAGAIPQGVLDVQIMPAQYLRFAYVMAFSVATCLKFAAKYREAEQLSNELEARVNAQTQALRESYVRLKREQVQRQRFVTGIVHNLRSPLFALGGNLELLRGELASPTSEEKYYLDLLDRKLDHINHMVDDMLLVSRLEDGDIVFRFTNFSAASLLDGTAMDIRSKGAARGVSVSCRVEPDGLLVVGDQFRLKQALDNLADNALRFSPDGGTVLLGAELTASNTVRISVEDQGHGVAEAQKAGLFSRSEDVDKPGSTGMGLTIVRNIAERHGGRVWLEKSDASGSIFMLELPVTQPLE